MMPTQPDAAEKILLKSDGPMHYTDIVDEAVRLGLIERTAKNSTWLNSNVRKAVSTDVRFIKIKTGVFDLASRHIRVSEDTTEPDTADVTEPDTNAVKVIPKFHAIRQDLEEKGTIEIEMKYLRDACGWGSIKKFVVEDIHAKLTAHDLGHVPTNLPMNQNAVVSIYQLSSPVGRLVTAVREEAEAGDVNKEIIEKIRDIINE